MKTKAKEPALPAISFELNSEVPPRECWIRRLEDGSYKLQAANRMRPLQQHMALHRFIARENGKLSPPQPSGPDPRD